MIDIPFNFKDVYKRRKILTVRRGLVISLISISDLKIMKRKSGRPQDLSDVKVLERIESIGKD